MKIHIFVIILFSISTISYSQVSVPNDVSNDEINGKLLDPAAESTLQSNLNRFQVSSTLGDVSAKLNVGFQLPYFGITTSLSQSFKEKPNEVNLFNLKGLNQGTTFSIGLNRTVWTPTADFNVFERIRSNYARNNNITNPDSIRMLTYDSMYDRLPISDRQALNNSIDWDTPFVFGLNFSVSKSEFDFTIDTTNFIGTNEVKVSNEISAYIGLVIESNIFAISFSHQNKYESNDPISIALPNTGNSPFYLKELIIGAPQNVNKNIYSIEYRRLFSNRHNNPTLAINPIFSLITSKNENIFSFVMPIFFLKEKDENNKIKGLNGGVSIGYSSPTKNFVPIKDGFDAKLFLTASFETFGIFN